MLRGISVIFSHDVIDSQGSNLFNRVSLRVRNGWPGLISGKTAGAIIITTVSNGVLRILATVYTENYRKYSPDEISKMDNCRAFIRFNDFTLYRNTRVIYNLNHIMANSFDRFRFNGIVV